MKDFQISIKLMEWWTIVQIAVTSNDLKNLLILLKMVRNIVFDFSHTYQLNY